MKKITQYILTIFIIGLAFWNVSADDNNRNEFVSWERPNITNIYNDNDQKFVFLVQFDTHDYTDQVYKYDFRIGTNERWKTCTWDFIVKSTSIYMVCWVLITDKNIIDQEYTLYLEVRDKYTNNQELEIFKTYNEWITAKLEDIDTSNAEAITEEEKIENINNNWEEQKVSPKNTSNIDNKEDSPSSKTDELEIEINKRLDIFFQKIEQYSLERKIILINKVLNILEQINTDNEDKKILIQVIQDKFLEEKKILEANL